jgi:predicted Zn-dependent peptidase
MTRRACITAATLLLLLSVTLSVAGEGADGLPPGYVSQVLDNGLRVSILSVPPNTVVATQLWYHVGSANEEASSRGFAHLFEHLMFGKTANHEKDEYANHHHRYGGYENAYTSFDETVYVSTIAEQHHSAVLGFEADRMVNLVLDEENLENEKKIVSEELRVRMENDPYSRIGVAALKAVFGEHPYAYMPGGTREDVAAATLDQCLEFYESYYRPRNAHLVIVGPVDAEEKLAEVRELFGDLPAEGVTPPDVPALVDWEFPEEVTLKEDLPPAELAILGYSLPPADGEDYWAITLMQQLLGGGAVDQFEESLVTRRRKAVHASTEWMATRRGEALMFNAAFLPYRTRAKAFRLMEQALDELAALEWLTEESLASAKRTLLRREMNRVYYADSRADAIGRARWWQGDERVAFDAARRIEAVTRDEVERVFREYVMEARPVRVYLRPEKIPLYVRLFGWMYPLVRR